METKAGCKKQSPCDEIYDIQSFSKGKFSIERTFNSNNVPSDLRNKMVEYVLLAFLHMYKSDETNGKI